MAMKRGRIKKINQEKGSAFISPEGDSKDVYFLVSKVQGGYPKENDKVEFEVQETSQRPQAINIKLIPKDALTNGQGKQRSAKLPPSFVFDTFYNRETGKLKDELFYDIPEKAAKLFKKEGLTSSSFRNLYQGLLSFILPLRDKRISFEEAREKFGIFYTERVVRQNNRNQGDKTIMPDIVLEWFNRHRELAISSKEEMLGLFRFITSVLCYFEA